MATVGFGTVLCRFLLIIAGSIAFTTVTLSVSWLVPRLQLLTRLVDRSFVTLNL
jgi:hypothetical protein